MLSKNYRRFKKLKTEGVKVLPRESSQRTVGDEGDSGLELAEFEVMQGNIVARGWKAEQTPGSAGPGGHAVHNNKVDGESASEELLYSRSAGGADTGDFGEIYVKVTSVGGHNYRGARVPVPSGLNVDAWRRHLQGYHDYNLPDFLEFGWPVNCELLAMLQPTFRNHPSAVHYPGDIQYYIETELGFRALGGPYDSQPFTYMQISPLMTRIKKDSQYRRVIMDLSWPPTASVNDAIRGEWYVDGLMTIKLPTVDYMEGRLLELGRGAYLYKTDLARGYRQLRVDPSDWPLLGFMNEQKYYFDICPPFGLRTSALCMQRTAEGISWIHGQRGFLSRPYLDDFEGAEASQQRADEALVRLQDIMAELGVREAIHKICRPAQQMLWLGLWYNSIDMTISIPEVKLQEIMEEFKGWEGKLRSNQRDMQRLLGLIQFIASVSPPARVFSNRMLTNLREMPKQGTESLSLGFKSDLRFFLDILPDYKGIRIIDKSDVPCQAQLKLDACLTGCRANTGGAYYAEEFPHKVQRQEHATGGAYYAEEFPHEVQRQEHAIARLELLNVVVALKVWGKEWRGHKVQVKCDNMNACLAVQTGRSRDPFLQHCVRELFTLAVSFDVEVRVRHWPGKDMTRADALSKMHKDRVCREWMRSDYLLARAERVTVGDESFQLVTRC